MPRQVKVIVLRTAGTNCDQETVFAFRTVGADVDLVHINRLFSGEISLDDYHILAIPGGFTYGDDVAAGRILANELTKRLGKDICRFIRDKKLIIGICNGFQVLTRAGILPGPLNSDTPCTPQELVPRAALTNNDSGKFEDRWIHLKVCGRSVWTEGLEETLFVPIAHGEGKFVPVDQDILKKLRGNGQIAFRYCSAQGRAADGYPDNPNGSVDDIAGITDQTGRILGLMPHPERHFLFTQHPFWTRLKQKAKYGQGARVFENGVRYVREHLLSQNNAGVSRILA